MLVHDYDTPTTLHGSGTTDFAATDVGVSANVVNGHTVETPVVNDKHNGFVSEEVPLGEPRRLRVICIGAGATGLNLAYMLPRHLKNIDLLMYEKNEAIGGTWLENRYPGIACDIPAHIYQFTWAPNPTWSEFYASGPEILRYFQDTAKKFDLEKYVNLKHRVTRAEWNEDDGTWMLEILNEETQQTMTDYCHFLINGSGFLNHWTFPKIPGLHSFKGPLMHTANWDNDVPLENQKIGLIGNGSSGIQLLTAIQPVAKHLTTFIRSPTWITTVYLQDYAGPGGSNFEYTPEQIEKYKKNPEEYLNYRKAMESDMSGSFDISFKDSDFQQMARQYLTEQMKKRLGEDHPLSQNLIPDFSVGCRRLTPGTGYLEALTQSNVTVERTPIARVVPEGIELENGELVELDLLACATGFDVSWAPRFPIIGRKGINLQEEWSKTRASAYMALGVPNFPNYTLFLGPGGPLSHGSALPSIEHQTKYIARLLYKMQIEGYKAAVPSQAATQDFISHMHKFNERTVWSGDCNSWFKGGVKENKPLCHPGSRTHWFHMLTEPRWEDWDWERLSENRFSYLGNGWTTWEKKGQDLSYYLDDPDSGYQSLRY
ncbi:hypothetical protein CEP51_004722 [Fusarium floridanum]|uniref:Sterigmatocystin biosynthesis monooxygenase stcW n=1 Tax=Fusarium floridanum TaxID=1325733 RepID=A0A428RZV7_9HYPO|nr:hypothetical protein CEP51_004722 [Fusarium floridanum]